jgi:sensor histidine kinase YesM
MKTPQYPTFYKKLSDQLAKKKVYHSLIWVTYLFLLVFLSEPQNYAELLELFPILIGRVAFLSLLVYSNLYILIPYFFVKRKILIYFLTLFAICLFISVFELSFVYLISNTLLDYSFYLSDKLASHFLFILFLVLGSSGIKIAKDWFIKEQIQRQLEQKNLQSEINFLKSQINPHFLFNTLNSIYAHALKKSDETPELIIRLSEMMRYLLYESNVKEVPLLQEINYLKNYLELERIRNSNFIKIESHFPEELELNKFLIAPLLLLPFVENAFKHISYEEKELGVIQIQLSIDKNELQLRVSNPFHPNQNVKSNDTKGGFGLENVRNRLNLMYHKAYHLHASSDYNIYQVHLNIQLNHSAL